MKIAANMNLAELAERMGTEATESEAFAMRELLTLQFNGQDTVDVPEADWLTMLDQVANA
ncbi:MAG: hypothetical protein EPN77_19460 [Candidimonas sp.]|nr:MAG: hypothetical protein EPN77_19460 [Candidimonas sp.]